MVSLTLVENTCVKLITRSAASRVKSKLVLLIYYAIRQSYYSSLSYHKIEIARLVRKVSLSTLAQGLRFGPVIVQ